MIQDLNLNRFIVASCTPRTHEALFRGTLQEAGLNPYLFELVNIREHASWVHMNDPEAATQKAIELIKMNIAKVRELNPEQKKQIGVLKSVLVIGGGPAGLLAADNLANQDFDVYLVEKESTLGGGLNKISRKSLLDNEKPVVERLDQVLKMLPSHPRVKIFTSSRVEDVSGFVGNYKVKVSHSGKSDTIEAGGIVVATGVTQDQNISAATSVKSPKVYTQDQFETAVEKNELTGINRVGFIQCTNQRHDGTINGSDFPNCSGICCRITLKLAKLLHELHPSINVHILQRGMQLSGDVQGEALFDEVQQFAVIARYSPERYPEIKMNGNELMVSIKERNTGEDLDIPMDAVVLATPYKSAEGTRDLAMQLKVPVTQDGFMLEAHVKLRPVDFATEGIFIAGSAQWPKTLEDAAMQGFAASARAIGLLSRGYVEAEGITAEVDPDMCIGCGQCAKVCPYSAIEMVQQTKEIDMEQVPVMKAHVIDAMCKGCGTCIAQCPTKAVDQRHFKAKQISAMIKALFEAETCTFCGDAQTATDGGKEA